jgi:hypothetical protein
MFFAFTDNDHWEPGIGDPTVVGWVTVVAYFIAAWLCWRAARHARQATNKWIGASGFWSLLTVSLVLLGFNKQLDLQTWFTLFFKHVALHEGWYEKRRPVQAVFIATVAVGGAASLAAMRALAGKTTRSIRLALFGAVFLGCFILVRASSFHHVDQMLGMDFEGFKLNWILELGGIAIIAAAAMLALRSRPNQTCNQVAVEGPNFIWVSAGDRSKQPPAG